MKNEKGAITLYVTIACLFILIIGIANYIQISNKRANQEQILKQTEESYNQGNIDDIYKKYKVEDIIPIYTSEQLNKVGKGEEVYVAQTGKIYKFDINKTYVLQNNIFFEGEWENTNYLIKNDMIILEKQGNTIISTDSNGILTTDNCIIKPKDSETQIVIPKGFAPVILQTNSLQSLPGEDGRVKNKMPAEEWNNITEEDINKGVVVVDADGNEFVWIPIPDSSKFARIAWTTKCGYDESGSWQNETLTTPQQLADKSTENKWWEDKTTSEYTNMVRSVENNKGFYVARYEASSNNDSTKAQSKRGATVWTYISQTDAITKSANYNTVLHSHLMYGIEWDSILNWLNGNATISSSTKGKTKTMDINDLQTNSCSWGNYSDSTGDASTNSGSAYTKPSGTSEYWKANNIYDLAGNMSEWTQEKYSSGTIRAIRGGFFSGSGARRQTAALRDSSIMSITMHHNVGFRTSFYL